jgi:hypothetical protein
MPQAEQEVLTVHKRQLPGARWFRRNGSNSPADARHLDGQWSKVTMPKNIPPPTPTGAPVAAYYRLARALREAADAVEEIATGKVKPRRHRGPVRVDGAPTDEKSDAIATLKLRRAGLVPINGSK